MLYILKRYTDLRLRIDRVSPYEPQVFGDLMAITKSDSGLGFGFSTDPTVSAYVTPIRYTPTTSGLGQTRVNQLVNELSRNVFIMGLDGKTTLPDGTYGQPGVTHPEDLAVYIFYDVTACGGEGWFAFDAAGKKIDSPSDVILYHELSHAHDLALGMTLEDHDAYELSARKDENDYRNFRDGPTAHLRDLYGPNRDKAGCGKADTGPTPKPKGWSWLPKICFVTSVAGMGDAPAVKHWKEWRENFISNNGIGYEIFAKAAAEYYQFSVFVAQEIAKSQQLKKSVKDVMLEPLLIFFNLSMLYIERGWKQEESFSETVESVLIEFITSLTISGYTQEDIITIHDDIIKGIRILNSDFQAEPTSQSPVNNIFTNPDYQIVFRLIREHVPAPFLLNWAFISPLEKFWTVVSQKIKYASNEKPGNLFAKSIFEWLEKTPIPSSVSLRDENSIRKDLEHLALNIFTNPLLKQKIGERIMRECETVDKHRLMRILEETGYLEPLRS